MSGHDDRVVAVLGEFAQRLLALGVVLDFEVAVFDAALGLEFLRPVESGFVEGFVELAAEIINDRRLDVRGEGRDGHRCSGQKAQYETLHVIHTLSVVFSVYRAGRPDWPPRSYGRSGSPPARAALLHGAEQISRRILTFWKSRAAAAAARQNRLVQAPTASGTAQATPVPLRPQ
jgi:hypothetical protein